MQPIPLSLRKAFCLLSLLFLGVCNAQAPEAVPFFILDYQIIGGKSGASVETTRLDCVHKTLSLTRTSQQGELLTQHQTAIDNTLCEQVYDVAKGACDNYQGVEKGVYDAASYRLKCNIDNEVRLLHWQGTWRKAPSDLQALHNDSRHLLQQNFPTALIYP
ncbi:hypothetical protein ACP3V3_19775 [Vibrio sp. PNB22_3_1]